MAAPITEAFATDQGLPCCLSFRQIASLQFQKKMNNDGVAKGNLTHDPLSSQAQCPLRISPSTCCVCITCVAGHTHIPAYAVPVYDWPLASFFPPCSTTGYDQMSRLDGERGKPLFALVFEFAGHDFCEVTHAWSWVSLLFSCPSVYSVVEKPKLLLFFFFFFLLILLAGLRLQEASLSMRPSEPAFECVGRRLSPSMPCSLEPRKESRERCPARRLGVCFVA